MRRFLGCLVKDKRTSEQEFYVAALRRVSVHFFEKMTSFLKLENIIVLF